MSSQQLEIQLQVRKDSLNTIDFQRRVQTGLRDVSIMIAKLNLDVSDRYGTVKRIDNNLFQVEFQGEVQKDFLVEAIFREFGRMSVIEDFQLGIFNESEKEIDYSNLFRYDGVSGSYKHTDIAVTPPSSKYSNNEPFFLVYFPSVTTQDVYISEDIASPWLFLILVCTLILIYLTYSVVVIVRQKRLSDIKTDFINNMTHELKTPIATIKLSSTALLSDDFSKDSDRLQRYASIIYNENKRLEEQVERVLTIAKMDKKSTPLKKGMVDIHDFVLEAQETYGVALEEIDGIIDVYLNAKRHVVYVDPVHIKNVVFNLLDNAIKYRREDVPVKLKIETGNDKKNFTLKITDNGIGIDKSDVKLIFDKFYRVPKGDVHDVKGFGLGLYYVKNIVEQHKGTVQLKSELGKGSTFIITLPFKAPEEE